jgi:hydrogenase/urease accessory protein HupE
MTRRLLLAVLLWLGLSQAALTHEVRPAYLQIQQVAAARYVITWKQPTLGDTALRLVPHLSNGWLERPAVDQYSTAGFLIRTWRIDAAVGESLAGATVEIEGLADSITDTLLGIRWQDGRHVDVILRPEQPRHVIAGRSGLAVPAYLRLGVEHILTGPDHLLFVLGLMLLVSSRWMLLKTVTAFTVAHSLTLALTVTGWLRLPSGFIETMIALSILLLAGEIVRMKRGGRSLAIERPWLVAFLFGLFHGIGFGGALLDMGFPPDALVATLALFNLGVELGQLAFIAAALLVARLLARWPLPLRPVLMAVPVYVLGVGGAYWALARYVQWLAG